MGRASITRYTTATKAVRYSVRFRTPTGSQTQKRGFKTKRDAEMFLPTTEVRKATGDYVAPSQGRVTVGELWPGWFTRKEQSIALATRATYEHIYRNHVAPRWAAVRVADVDVLGIEEWIAAMSRSGVSASLVDKAYRLLKAVLDDAVRGKRLASNPANLPKATGKRCVYLTEDDVARLADEAAKYAPRYGTLVLVVAYTGIRWGEAVGLRVSDIDFLQRRLSITRSVTLIGGRRVVKSPKSDKSRWVPVAPFVIEELSVCCIGKAPDDLVFPRRATRSSDGGGFMPQPYRGVHRAAWFHRAVQRAGVQDITPHDLRHTCASLSVRAGVNVLALSRMLGHSQPSITLNVYADLFDSDLDAVGGIIEARYATAHTDVSKVCPRGVFGGPSDPAKRFLTCADGSAGSR